jgi:hypothetical protein
MPMTDAALIYNALLLLPAPPMPRKPCPSCEGSGRVRLNLCMVARECPTCRGSGIVTADRYGDEVDYRAWQLGLAPRRT